MDPSSPRAVFISYAREDTDAARRITDALRGFGVEVWFDQSELRGADAWDQKIRRQIKECALFLPIISQHTQARTEGYFRLEWKLAAERTHLMAEGKPFIAPVAIDNSHEENALVPPEFMRVQWTRLPQGLPTPQFTEQIKRLLETKGKIQPAPGREPLTTASMPMMPADFAPKLGVIAGFVMLLLIGGCVYFFLRPAAKPPSAAVNAATETKPAMPTSSPAASLGEKSIAVLPFANLSSEKENEFFADSLQDDVITNLAKIGDLTVISRTSTLAYRDAASRNLKKIGGELGVATVLEGSVRRVGTKVHMNAQLIDARTDAHLWAETFDGDASDIFALQASLAQKIAAALKATLTPGERTLIERRPTQNQDAYELYSRARLLDQALPLGGTRAQYDAVVALYEQAIARDPEFALAFAQLTGFHGRMYWIGSMDSTPARRARAQAALDAAQRLAPTAPETGLARGMFAYFCDHDWQRALAEYTAVEPSMPNDARLHAFIAAAERRLGRVTEAAAQFERAVALDPQDRVGVISLVETVFWLRRYADARTFGPRFLTLFPGDPGLSLNVLRSQFALDGDRAAFLRGLAAISPNETIGFRLAMLRGDYSAADQMMGERGLRTLDGFWNVTGGSVVEPPALLRAEIAFLRGQPDLARKYADEAVNFYRTGSWTKRQQPAVPVELARAEALAGRVETALRDAPGAVARLIEFDPWAGISALPELGRIYLICGKPAEALDCLRRTMAAPGPSPNEIRLDPIWSRLKDDPRFEEILKSAKVF